MKEGVNKTRKQSKTADNFKTGEDLFTYLPSDIILNILSRLPPSTVMSCKCVCKPWLDLLTTPEFVKSDLSKSVPCLAVFLNGVDSKPYKLVEFEDDHRLNIVFNFDLPIHEPMHSSVNGLLILYKGGYGCDGGGILLCNPITRNYFTILLLHGLPPYLCLGWRFMDLK